MNQKILRKLQLTQLYILDKVVEVCDHNNLTYFLYEGTLLGAIRHNGMIPWDDDIDIAMPRKDYDHFLEIAQKNLGDAFFVQHYTTDKNYTRFIIKIRLNGTRHIEPCFEKIDMHQGIYIDIFPLDLVSGKKRNLQIRRQLLDMISRIISIKKRSWAADEIVKNKIKKCIRPFCLLFSDCMLYYLFERICRGDSSIKSHQYYACFTSSYNIIKEVFPINYFNSVRKQKFENKIYNIPFCSEEILSRVYGDYMKLPSEEERKTHNIIEINFGDK